MSGITLLAPVAMVIWEQADASLELWRPALAWLALPAFALWWLWSRRPETRIAVGTTFLWQRVTGRTRGRRSLKLLLLLLLLVCATLRPMAWRAAWRLPPDLPRVQAHCGTPSSEPTLELLLPSGRNAVVVEARAGEAPLFRERILLDPSQPTLRVVVLPAALRGRDVIVRLDQTVFELSVPAPTPIVVRDRSASQAVHDALSALAASGWTRWADDASGEPPEVEIARADEESGATAGDSEVAGVASLLLPRRDGSTPSFLPRPLPAEPPHPWLSGLTPERWTVARASPAPVPRDHELVLDSTAGALITRSANRVRFAFDPADSDLPESAVWPVLVARILADLREDDAAEAGDRSARTGASPIPDPSAWPTVLLLGLAVIGVFLVLRNPGRWIAATLIGGAAVSVIVWPPRLGTGGPTRELAPATAEDGTDRGPAARILAAAAGAPPGTRIRVPRLLPAPLEIDELRALLGRREIAIDPIDMAPGAGRVPGVSLQVIPSRAAVNDTLTIKSVDSLRPNESTTNFSGRDLPGDARLHATSPKGVDTLLEDRDESAQVQPSWRHNPNSPGVWHYTLATRAEVIAGATAVIEGRIAVAVMGSVEFTPAYFDERRFAITEIDLERVAATGLAEQLPEPADQAALVWQDLDPARLPVDAIRAVSDWVASGGTLFASAGALLIEPSPSLRALQELLPAALPDAPRERETDLGIVLLDVSGSLRPAQRSLVATAQLLLRGTPEGGRWGVAAFQDRPWWLAPPGSRPAQDLIEALDQLRAGGGTDLASALEFVIVEFAAGRAEDTPTRERSLVLVSDGRAPVSPEQLAHYGRRLTALGVEVLVLAIGAEPDEARLRALTESNAGTYRRTPDADSAATALAAVMRERRGPWEPVDGSLQVTSLDPLVAHSADAIPAPRRRVAVDPEPARGGRVLWSDSVGGPVLLTRRLGRGHVLLFASGWDAKSVPAGRAGSTLARALGRVIAAGTRQQPASARAGTRRVDATGNTWACFPRALTDLAATPRALRPANASGAPSIRVDTTATELRARLPRPNEQGTDDRTAWNLLAAAESGNGSVDHDSMKGLGWLPPGPPVPLATLRAIDSLVDAPPTRRDVDLALLALAAALALWAHRSDGRRWFRGERAAAAAHFLRPIQPGNQAEGVAQG
ncbi:MAG: VWA domain-containing protein [Planctomycetota bacterium]